jgi:uncharacterized protein YqiB (DUF1249 family)
MNAKLSPRSSPPSVEFRIVHDAMLAYATRTHKGGRCVAWRDFLRHCKRQFGESPRSIPDGTKITRQFADYWLQVAAGNSPDYDAETGNWVDTDD